MKKILILFLLALPLAVSVLAAGKREIVNLRTCYMTCPLGLDINPTFSWEMKADGYGAKQIAYCIKIADSPAALEHDHLVYTTDRCESELSVCRNVDGFKPQPKTRYYWQVVVWDEKGVAHKSSSENWFEMGLMGGQWGMAQWIGSPSSILSKNTGVFALNLDFQIAKGSNEASFVVSHMDDNNYLLVTISGGNGEPALAVSYVRDGKAKEFYNHPLGDIMPADKLNDKHHLVIDNLTHNHFIGYQLKIDIDGRNVADWDKKTYRDGRISVKPAPEVLTWIYARLYGVGTKIAAGQHVAVENLTITQPRHKVVLYEDLARKDIVGTGKIDAKVPNGDVAAPIMRKEFKLTQDVRRARLYATARGIYEMEINGRKVSDEFFAPGWHNYMFRQPYNVYDVTNMLKKGDNAIGGMLGNGWYCGAWGYHSDWTDAYGTDLSLRAMLEIKYMDGTTARIVTDPSWRVTDDGPITENSWQNGEDYDARREIQGWSLVGFDDKSWKPVKVYPMLDYDVQVQSYIGSPVAVDTVCSPVKMTEPIPGHYIYDMGQNMVGVPRITFRSPAGTCATIKFAEMLYPEVIPTEPVAPYTIEMYKERAGQMYLDNYRGALTRDNYICAGRPGGETYTPRFTSHGFRYLEITGVDKALAMEDVKVLVLNSIPEKTAAYECSDANINKLYSNILWGQLGNFLAVPTDCPQRDERLGWTGDAQIFARTATYNRNVQPFFTRWLYSLRDDQGPDGSLPCYTPLTPCHFDGHYDRALNGWADVGIIVPWQVYQQYGDVNVIRDSYSSMKRYMQFLEKRGNGYIQPIGGYGDWVSLLGTPSDLTNTAYTAYVTLLFCKMARVIGENADADHFDEFYNNTKKAFQDRFITADGQVLWPKGSPANRDSYSAAYGRGPKTDKDQVLDTQTGYILPLYADLFPAGLKAKAVDHLVKLLEQNGYKLNTGFIGTPYMNLVLSDNGRDDVAYKMFQQKEYPSWIYPVLQGATTIWERWNSYTIVNGFGPVSMNSFNHYSYGAIQDWMMVYNAGIQRDEAYPGYKHFLLQPRVGGLLGYTRASYKSPYGEICSAWHSSVGSETVDAAGKPYTYEATVPANTTATLTLQTGKKMAVKVIQGKEGIVKKAKQKGETTFELASGQYKFEVK